MDKSKREILYKPPTQIETGKQDEGIVRINTTPKVPIKKEPPKQKEEPTKEDGKKMAKWINEAVLLNLSALCKEAKVDRGNFDKYLKIGEIPEKFIESVKKVISKYGYL